MNEYSRIMDKVKRQNKLKRSKQELTIAIIGKYVELKDSYKSIYESLMHASALLGIGIEIKWIHSERIRSNTIAKQLFNCQAVIIAPGFGSRGIHGKLTAVKYVRENKIPFLGICLGMQIAVIEFFRNVCGHKTAHSSEMNPDTKYPVIDLMKKQVDIVNKGGTMRLGSYSCKLVKNSKCYNAYKSEYIKERHRHRYELNNIYRDELVLNGMSLVGCNQDLNLVEIIELPNHPWFVGVQFHPEYQSSFIEPHPLFISFINASLLNR